jgi:quercetin 2,3-dioxygenase
MVSCQGFQLWVNLPAKKKMTDPKYRGITKHQIPTIETKDAKIRVIAGGIEGTEGPINDLSIEIEYFDVELNSGKTFVHPTKNKLTVFVYLVNGSVTVQNKIIEAGQCAIFSQGDIVKISAIEKSRFLFVSGEPLKEPVAWRGPIVMNTQKELAEAYEELDKGTFIKKPKMPKSIDKVSY